MSIPGEMQVAALRDAQRRLVRELGMLAGFQNSLGATATQCHALIEIERGGELTPGALADLLNLDASTASRLVDSLLSRKWLKRVQNPDDRRMKRVALAAKGVQLLERAHARANLEAGEALARLSEPERETVVEGLRLYAAALQKARVARRTTVTPLRPSQEPLVVGLIRECYEEYAVERPDVHYDDELLQFHRTYQQKGFGYWVALEGKDLIGGAGLAPLPQAGEKACELRKMYVDRNRRGEGVGRQLLERFFEEARQNGYEICYLNTLERMHAARALYEKHGFRPIPSPKWDKGGSGCDCWMQRAL